MEKGIGFFRKRYEQLGGKIVPIKLKPTLRVNILRTTEKKLIARMKSIGATLKKVPFTRYGYEVTSKFSAGAIQEHFLGYYYMQEAAPQVAVDVLNPKSGDLVLDCCAAPGGKTTQISEWMGGKGRIIALEKKRHRIPSALHNLERMHTPNVIVYEMDAANAGRLQLMYDKILLDAPCAGNYVTDKDWFNKRDLEGIRKSAAIQRRLLAEMVKVLKPGGIMIYSTCSLEPEENELNMQWLLNRGDIKLEDTKLKIGDLGLTTVFGKKLDKSIARCRRFWPHKTKTQGFFIAKIKKK